MMKIVPDTSVIIDGRITELVKDRKIQKADVIIPIAVLSELEHQANNGKETGSNGLNEVIELQKLDKEGKITLHFIGNYPSREDIENHRIDSIIRDIAEETRATLFTSDKIQAQVAKAKGIKVYYLHPYHEEMPLKILKYFDEETMSIHLRQGCKPIAKKGKPGNFKLIEIKNEKITEKELVEMTHQIIEHAIEETNVYQPTNLTITKTDSADPVMPGDIFNYTIKIRNIGDIDANNVTIRERYDKNITFISSSPPPMPGNNDTWIASIPSGGLTRLNIKKTQKLENI